MKDIVTGKIEKAQVVYDVKIEDSKLKISAEMDLAGLVDEAAVAIPGDSAVEQLVIGLIKSALAKI